VTKYENKSAIVTTNDTPQPWDIPNWLTMLTEIGVGIFVTFLIFIKTKQTNNSIHLMMEKIKDTTSRINATTTEMDEVVKRIGNITEQQSEVMKIIEQRRKNRISWFTYHSLGVLSSLKENYEKLYKAIEEYQKDRTDKNKTHMMAVIDSALQISVNHTVSLIQRDIQIAIDYINNTWLVAKFPDELAMIGYEFGLVKNTLLHTFIYDEDLLHSKQMVMEKINRIQFYIDTIRAEEL